MSMEKKNGNNTIWDEVIAFLHGDSKEEIDLSKETENSSEFKFSKKVISVRDKAALAREISTPSKAWNHLMDKQSMQQVQSTQSMQRTESTPQAAQTLTKASTSAQPLYADKQEQTVTSAQTKRRVLPGLLRYAAVVTIALIIGSLFTLMMTKPDQQTTPLAYTTVEAPYGQMSKITLSDGTAVWLNSGTTLKYPNIFNQENRSVEINGEGFFDVTTDPEHPFIVETNQLKVKVLGTSFNVNAYKEDTDTEITLLEGKVELLNRAGTRIAGITPGEQAVLDNQGLTIKKVDTRFYDSWREGRMEFSGVQLKDIVKKLERWYNVEITLEGNAIEETLISGTIMRYKPIDQILKAMRIMGDIDYTIKSNPSGKDQIKLYKK
ncbi:DUF4974 domain-containing protein [Puteibacter caeruleilacunae]|nr:DUF4974 domain-containing protein [Puteibacter caeruleilacunae]